MKKTQHTTPIVSVDRVRPTSSNALRLVTGGFDQDADIVANDAFKRGKLEAN